MDASRRGENLLKISRGFRKFLTMSKVHALKCNRSPFPINELLTTYLLDKYELIMNNFIIKIFEKKLFVDQLNQLVMI